MAIYMHSQDAHFFYKVTWLILIIIVCGADSGFMRTGNIIEKGLHTSSSNKVSKSKRSTIEEKVQSPTYHNDSELITGSISEEMDNAKEKSLKVYGNESKEIHNSFGLNSEHSKSKTSNKFKNAVNDHKSYNYNKSNMEIKHVALNASNTFVSETPFIQEHNLKSLNKNENFSEFHLNVTMSTTPSGYMLENKRDKLSLSTNIRSKTVLEPDNRNLMNGKALNTTGYTLSNLTYTNVDDLINLTSPNTTNTFNEGNDTAADGRTKESSEDMDILVMSGVGLGAAMIMSLIAGGGYLVYRRQIWNKPHTLSDKCSNADSSGYIDDSTLRENSEEMYSLDNDSFLNSLEAMTIQNYWTDNVKHTKL